MGKRIEKLTPKLIDFIVNQKLFFVATALENGRINLSPKGMDSLRVINGNRLVWMNLTGSGNETAAHLQINDRITIMFCAFEGKPIILRLYGTAKAYHKRDQFWKNHIDLFPKIAGRRQLIDVHFDLVQISCGMGVPLMDYREERDALKMWADKQGKDGLEDYHENRNATSLDGHPTGILG